MSGEQRIGRIRSALSALELDALVCALPKNVLLLSGYWPVIGASVALAFNDGAIELLVPEDEAELAQAGWAGRIRTFKPGSLERLTTAAEALREPLGNIDALFTRPVRIAIESGETSEPASYAAMNLFGDSLRDSLKHVFPEASVVAGDDLIRELGSVKTGTELDRIRAACALTRVAFEQGALQVAAGCTELELAQIFHSEFVKAQGQFPAVNRTQAFFFAMSGTNSAQAHGAYARSRTRQIEPGDLVLIHCNTCADGYWTDITRTYSAGKPEDRRNKMYKAIFAAREAALKAIAPGRKAADVDAAARTVLEQRDFGKEFKHSTGHGVGFGAISPNALPRIHPKSPDVLEPGMVFNVEPAIYIDGFGGMRHCDMVAVNDSGYELLTPFQTRADDLFVSPGQASSARSA